MENIIGHTPQKKSSLWALCLFAVRCFFGLILGIVINSVGVEIIGYGQLSSIFVTLVTVFLVVRLTKKWALTNVLILILFTFLLFMLLNTYISIAPGE